MSGHNAAAAAQGKVYQQSAPAPTPVANGGFYGSNTSQATTGGPTLLNDPAKASLRSTFLGG